MSKVGRFGYGRNGQSLADGKAGWRDYQVCVGQFLENAWGLYDMHGNVWELCRDFYKANLGYGGVIDPKGADSGNRVMRGGAFDSDASACRSSSRTSVGVSSTNRAYGFRVYCSPVAQ